MKTAIQFLVLACIMSVLGCSKETSFEPTITTYDQMTAVERMADRANRLDNKTDEELEALWKKDGLLNIWLAESELDLCECVDYEVRTDHWTWEDSLSIRLWQLPEKETVFRDTMEIGASVFPLHAFEGIPPEHAERTWGRIAGMSIRAQADSLAAFYRGLSEEDALHVERCWQGFTNYCLRHDLGFRMENLAFRFYYFAYECEVTVSVFGYIGNDEQFLGGMTVPI